MIERGVVAPRRSRSITRNERSAIVSMVLRSELNSIPSNATSWSSIVQMLRVWEISVQPFNIMCTSLSHKGFVGGELRKLCREECINAIGSSSCSKYFGICSQIPLEHPRRWVLSARLLHEVNVS